MKRFSIHLVEETHTHKGHCPACGRIQAVRNDRGTVAKHGYEIKGWGQGGYFVGTCHGSDNHPLEKSREYTDHLIKGMHEQAAHHKERADAHRAKTTSAGHVHALNYYGSPEYKKVEGSYPTKRVAVHKPWDQASQQEKEHHWKAKAAEHESAHRWLKGHAESMKQLADKVHGQPLTPNHELNAPARKIPTIGSRFKIEHEHVRKDEHGNDVTGKHGKIERYKKMHEYEVQGPGRSQYYGSTRPQETFVVKHLESGKQYTMTKRDVTKHVNKT